jgi:adenylate kinase family enzyme
MTVKGKPKRVVVVGSSCAGKTTFALRLATVLGIKHVELDALYWEPNWKEADELVFKSRVLAAIVADSWVVDGNYSKIKEIVWPLADTLIWLDPPLFQILRRFFFRSLRRSMRSELLWGHCRETLKSNIFSHNSLLMWILSTHRRRTKAYLDLMQNPPENLEIYRFHHEKQINDFFQQLSASE